MMIDRIKAIGFDLIDAEKPQVYIEGVLDAIHAIIELEEEGQKERQELCKKLADHIDKKEEPTEEPTKEPAKKPKVDVGKIRALAAAGWKVTDIAKEVHCSEQTVRNWLVKKEEER